MKEINIINDHIFTLAGVPYGRIYQPIKMGENHFGIYNVYDSRQQILASTRYDEVTIDGTPYSSLNALLIDLVGVLFNPTSSGGGGMDTSGQHFRVININLTGTGTEKQRVVNTINNLSPFTISSDEVVLFRIVSAPSIQQAVQIGQNISIMETFYLVEGMGTGSYGAGNTQITATDTVKLTQTSATATEVNFGNIGFQSPWNYGNENGPYELSGITIIKAIQEGVEYTYIFNGEDGTYGLGETPFIEENFQELGQNEVTVISDGLPPRVVTVTRNIEVQDLNRLLEVAEPDVSLTIPESLYQTIDAEGLTSVYFRIEWQSTGGSLTYEDIQGTSQTRTFTQGSYIKVEKRIGENGYIVKAWEAGESDDSFVPIVGDVTKEGIVTFEDSPKVPTPILPEDAVNKAYVDSQSGGGDSNYILIGGQPFEYRQNPENTGTTIQVGDVALNGFIDETRIIGAASYLGGDPTLLESWEVLSFIDLPEEAPYPIGILKATFMPDVDGGITLPLQEGGEYGFKVYHEGNNIADVTNWTDRYLLVGGTTPVNLELRGYIWGGTFNGNSGLVSVEEFGEGFHAFNGDRLFGSNMRLEEIASDLVTSHFTTTEGMFQACVKFNGPLINFDTSNVVNMKSMFLECTVFNQSVAELDTSKVTDMSSMFRGCENFDQPLTNFDTSNVTTMEQMFTRADIFNQPIGHFNTANVVSMNYMFGTTSAFNQSINDWNVTSLESAGWMFNNAVAYNQDMNLWTLDSLTSMPQMFAGATSFNGNISTWNTSNVTSFTSLFSGATSFNGDISGWNTANVYTLYGTFREATAFNQDISGWNTSGVMDFRETFNGATAFYQDITDWDVSNSNNNTGFVDVASFPYQYNPFNKDNYDIVTITYDPTINNITEVSPPLVGRPSVYIDGQYLGNKLRSETIPIDPVEKTTVTYYGTLANENSFVRLGTQPNYLDITYFEMSDTNRTYSEVTLENLQNLEVVELNNYSKTSTANSKFLKCSKLVEIRGMNFGSATTANSTLGECTAFNQDISDWDVSGLENTMQFFVAATSFNQDLSAWNMTNVTTTSRMFFSATSYNNGGQPLAWTNFKTTTIRSMFDGATAFNQDLTSWDMSDCTDYVSAFQDATSFNGDVSTWDTSSATSFLSMFRRASSFNGDIGGWNVEEVTGMNFFLEHATPFDQDLSGWCPRLVTQQPNGFNTGTVMNTKPEYQPIWGCPGQ